jgi:hypothetical protein
MTGSGAAVRSGATSAIYRVKSQRSAPIALVNNSNAAFAMRGLLDAEGSCRDPRQRLPVSDAVDCILPGPGL